MCGVAGILLVERTSQERPGNMAARMLRAMTHRGPDGRGMIADEYMALGSCRLAVIDLDGGDQPIANEDGSVIVVHNGEIYNFASLRRQLEELGHRFRTHSDTEVIVHSYEEWGRDCVRRFRGMFAFAVYDRRAIVANDAPQLFLARDRFGIKPLYYVREDGFFLFASELRSILASRLVRGRLDPVALDQYLAYQCVPAPRTLVCGVKALPPGASLVVRPDGELVQERYWDLLADRVSQGAAENSAEAKRRVGELLREAVSAHLVSDVPVGIFLSGGLDSSAIVALVREAGDVPRTFTVSFPGQVCDESAYARCVAERFRADHAELRLDEPTALDRIPEALQALDHPTGDGVNTYLVAGAARAAGFKVALSGLGGDELFGGYPSFARLARFAPLLRAWGRAPQKLRSTAARAVESIGRSSISATKVAALVAADGSLAASYPVMRQVFSTSQRRALLEPAWAEAARGEPDPYLALLSDVFAAGTADDSDTFARVAYAEARTYMHDLLLGDTDQMAMAHGLEVRVPFLDHPLAEYVMGLSDAVRWGDGIPKRLLVESLDGLLAADVVYRRKQGFVLPFDVWMRGPLRRFCEARLGPKRLGCRGILRATEVQSLWRAFLDRSPRLSWSRIWTLVALEEWLARNGF